MTKAIALIYGDEILDDLEFCNQHNKAIARYAHGIMTLQPAPEEVIREVMENPLSVPGWTHTLEEHPEDVEILKEFFKRYLAFRKKHGVPEFL